MSDIIVDEYEFELTAKALMVMNKPSDDQYDNWNDLMNFMRDTAFLHCNNNDCVSTGGFVLSAFDGHSGRYVRASVSAYVAERFVASLQRLVGGN